MTAPAAVIAGPAAVAVAGAWFFPWLVAAIAYYHKVSWFNNSGSRLM